MLKVLAAVLGSALPLFLFLGLLVGFLRRAGGAGSRPVWRGVGLGLMAALVMVGLKRNTGFVVREYYNLTLLVPMLAAELALLPALLVRRGSAGRLGSGRVFSAVVLIASALWGAYHFPDLMFLPLNFAVGVENLFSSLYAGKVIGYAAGLAAAAIALAAVARLEAQLPPRLAGLFLAAGLADFFASHLLALFQTLLGRGLIPRNPFLLRLTIDLINRSAWFLYLMLGLAALIAWLAAVQAGRADFTAENPAAARKLKAAARNLKRWSAAALAALAFSFLAVTVGEDYSRQANLPKPPLDIGPVSGAFRIPLPQIDDGHLHRFRYVAPDGLEIRFLAIKKNASAYGVGLDACDVCGPSGYYERSGQVVCMLCDVVMNISTIGFPGGCNPVPLAHRIADGELRIRLEDLQAGGWRFRP